MEHLGANLFFDYQISEKSNLSLSTGYQATLNQKPYFTAFSTSISQLDANGYYVNAKWKAGNLYSQVSYSSDERTGIYPFHSDRCKIADANVEYDFTREKFSLRPGLNIRQAYANNSSIMEGQPFYLGAFNKPYGNKFRTLSMYAFSTLAEWRPTNKLRIISGLRFDKFSINKNLSLNYEAGVTYRLNKNNMFRAVLSKANRAPFLLDTYVNMESRIIWPLLFESYNNQSPTNILANVSWGTKPDIQYLSISSLELAWRSKISPMVSIDVETFASRLTNPIGLIIYRDLFVDVSYTGSYPNIVPDSIVAARANANFVFDNYDAKATQVGFTPTISFNWYDKFRVKVFGTLQHTFLSGEVDVRFDTLVPFGIVGSDPENPILHMYERVKIHPMVYSTKSTPTFFGGLDINYNLNDIWNFNVNGYFCTQQTHTGLSYSNLDADITGDYGHFTQKIDPFLVLNCKINYLIGSKYNVYISARNVLGKHREFGFADNIGALYMMGFTYKF
jgi:iron complex outermembrane receptor protein